MNNLDKIRVIKLKNKGNGGLPRYRIQVGDKELADSVVCVTVKLDPNTSFTTVNMEFVTGDFEWKDEE